MIVVLVLALMMALLAACRPEPQPLSFDDPVWNSGESSVYQVTDLDGNPAGTAQIDIQAGGDEVGSNGWTVRREISAQGTQEIVFIEIAPNGYLPQTSHLVRIDSQGQQVVDTTFAGSQVDIALTNRRGQTVYERVQVPSDIRDERSLLVLVRSLPLQAGYATQLNSFLPITGQVDRVQVQVVKSEEITVPAGTYDTWLVELETTDRTTQLWIAKEPPYPMVKFVDGRSRAVFELTNFQSGA